MNQLRSGLEVLRGGSCLFFKTELSFLPEVLNLVSTKNSDFCLQYFSSCGNWNCKSVTDGQSHDPRNLPAPCFRLEMNHVKDAFIGLEARNVNQVLETARVRLHTINVTVHSCCWDNSWIAINYQVSGTTTLYPL